MPSYTVETVHFGPPYTQPSRSAAARNEYSATERQTERSMRSVRQACSAASPPGPVRPSSAP